MATGDDLPPSRSARPIDPPPASGRPTAAQLKGDIDSGRTGDKVGVFDPALAPLGTDDEAAGAPPSREAIAMARRQERGGPAGGGRNAPQGGPRVALYGFIASSRPWRSPSPACCSCADRTVDCNQATAPPPSSLCAGTSLSRGRAGPVQKSTSIISPSPPPSVRR